MEDVTKQIENLGINYKRYEHKAVLTCQESTALLPKDMEGVRTKNIFLRDRKKENYILVVVEENKLIDYKELSNIMNLKSLKMADELELKKYLDVEIGALSMLSLFNDKDKKVRLVIDKDIWDEEAFDCQPNTLGVVFLIWKEDWLKIFDSIKIKPDIIKIPQKY
jgi:Ala-tRNA(Pro) deacylase